MSGPEFIVFLAAILATTAIVIVAMAMSHQRKMAEFHRSKQADNNQGEELKRLKQEVSELKNLVYQQAVDADSMRQLLSSQEHSRSSARSVDLIVGRD